ncbi:MAG: TPM domain-containing protein [Planctomycetota bacterium]
MIENPRAFFTQQEKLDIDAAVAKAEKSTSGEIVPVLAARADDYPAGRYHAGITFAILATFVLVAANLAAAEMGWEYSQGPWTVPLWALLPAQFAALLVGYHLAARSWNLQRAFLPQALLQKRVAIEARRAFHDLELHKTTGSTGIMLYVSLFERVAIVVADKAIATKHNQQTWDGVRDLLIAGLKTGHSAKGFTDAIAECGRILSKDFPPSAENPNELPNELRVVG